MLNLKESCIYELTKNRGIHGGQFSWFVNFLQVPGDVISWISWLGRRGGLKGKITPEKFILFETSYLSLQ